MRKRKECRSEIFQAISLITQIALTMMVSMALSLFIGYWLDRLFHTRFIIIIMMFVGFGASIRSLFELTRGFTRTGKKNKEEEDG